MFVDVFALLCQNTWGGSWSKLQKVVLNHHSCSKTWCIRCINVSSFIYLNAFIKLASSCNRLPDFSHLYFPDSGTTKSYQAFSSSSYLRTSPLPTFSDLRRPWFFLLWNVSALVPVLRQLRCQKYYSSGLFISTIVLKRTQHYTTVITV